MALGDTFKLTKAEPEDEEEPIYSLRSKRKGVATEKAESVKPAMFHPKLSSGSDNNVNYDDYLNQLVEEEEEPVVSNPAKVTPLNYPLLGGESAGAGPPQQQQQHHTPSLDEQLSGDFPIMNTTRPQEKEETLQSLMGVPQGE